MQLNLSLTDLIQIEIWNGVFARNLPVLRKLVDNLLRLREKDTLTMGENHVSNSDSATEA